MLNKDGECQKNVSYVSLCTTILLVTFTRLYFLFQNNSCRIQLSEGISKYQQLEKESAATALNTVLVSAHT
jgi:hypothetical protein